MTQTKATWLRSEIEKLEGMKYKGEPSADALDIITWACHQTHNEALTSIITRYKEELKVLESK